jgi:uncharacterized membrane protein
MQTPDIAQLPETDHIEATIQKMASVNASNVQDVTTAQRWVASTTSVLAHPVTISLALAFVLSWIAFNAAAPFLGQRAFDPPPFPALDCAGSVIAVFIALLILATQRQEEELARRRAHLTLQLATLSEQKIAKVISLLEEQRRENPLLPSRSDSEAEDLARSADPARVLDRIIETHERPSPRRPSR